MVYQNTVNCFNKRNDTTGTLQDVMKIMFFVKIYLRVLEINLLYAIKVLWSSIKEWIYTVLKEKVWWNTITNTFI